MSLKRKPNGFILLSIVSTCLLLFTLFSASGYLFSSINHRSADDEKLVTFQLLIAELLEFFRSKTNLQLKQYLAQNPITGSTDRSNLYTLCSHINLIDRTNGNILNADPIAELPLFALSSSPSPKTKANRYYQIQIIDLSTMALHVNLCGKTVSDFCFAEETTPDCNNGIKPKLEADDTFLVTVGMSWIPDLSAVSAPLKRVVASTVIPPMNH